jgi:hypothetical protein
MDLRNYQRDALTAICGASSLFRKYVPSYFDLARRRTRRGCTDFRTPSGSLDLLWTYETLY